MFTDVLIVGAGPVGLILGCLLQMQNVQCIIIEKNSTRTSHSKAISINSASLQILNTLGLADKVILLGNKISKINVFHKDNLFYSLNYKYLSEANYSDFPFLMSLSQPEMETLLEERFLSLGGRIEKQKELNNFEKTKNTELYQSKVTNLNENKIEQYFSKYIVGCDGVKSAVRKNLSFSFHGDSYDFGFVLGDFNITYENEEKKIKTNEVNYYTNGDKFLLIVPLGNDSYRIVIQIEKDDIEKKFKNINIEKFQTLLNEHHGGIKINSGTSLSVTNLYDLFCNKIEHENIFLAGDAFHQFSPIGGLGMNTGFQDAFNLAWKIEHNLKKTSFKYELKTYEKERLPIVKSLNKSTYLSTNALLYKRNITPEVFNFISLFKKNPKNTNFRENIFPLKMSGIGQKYETTSSSFVGNFLFKNINNLNSSYKHNLIIFSKENDDINNLIKTYLKEFLEEIDVSYIDTKNFEKLSGFNSYEVENSIIFLRPDKMIEFKDDLKNINLLRNQLLKKNKELCQTQ